MQINHAPGTRRQFIGLMASLSTATLLAGCGGGEAATASPAISSVATAPVPVSPTTGTHPLNLVLNLAYLGSQFYGFAARGTGLSADLLSGVGQAGSATGARQVSFDDTSLASYAAAIADDKRAHVVALRAQAGTLAAAQPAIDLSATANGAFSRAAQGVGIVAAGIGFDPYASDTNFLLGAFLIENTGAAAYRTLLAETTDDATSTIVSEQLADAIYHGGLIRALLDDRATTDTTIGATLTKMSTLLATFDGSNVGDQTLAGASGASSNILDADGRPIPFTRASAQVLKALYLSSSGIGGFLPAGANGISS